MKITVEREKTLLVDGPASVALISGEVEVFGSKLINMGKVVIRDGKRMPFVVLETATFDVSLGENASVEEVDGSTIPHSWDTAYEKLAALQSKPATALVLGAADSGKTSFCTYLVNKLLNKACKIAILDGDLGQSDIGPPCTVAYAFISKPITDLFNLELENAFFVGVTSPSKDVDKVVQGLTMLKDEILTASPDFVVVNTDGWVEGEDAVKYKVQLIEKIRPDVIFCLKQDDRVSPILALLKNYETSVVESPLTIKQRSREKRRSLRELGYIKYLKNAKVLSLPLNWLKIENCVPLGFGKNSLNPKRERELCELLGVKPFYITEIADKICVVIHKDRSVNPENLRKTEEFTGKKVVVTFKGEEEGLLTALYNAEKKFLGIGVLREINYERKTMKIYTPVSSSVSTVMIGKVRLDKNLKETPFMEHQP